MFEEKPESGHRRNLSSVSTYSCPTSPKHDENGSAGVTTKTEILSNVVSPTDVNISEEDVKSPGEDEQRTSLERRHS